MPRDIQPTIVDDRGDETHPAFGVVTVHDISSTPGAVLFQSDLQHGRYIQIRLHEATRKRDLKHDWVHAGKVIAEFNVSQAQWAAMVSSMGNGSGTPVTITHREGQEMPGLPYEPRIARSLEETRKVVGELLARISEAFEELDRLEEAKAGIKDRREARRKLMFAIKNAKSNAAFAVTSMNEQAERTVGQAKADIETIVAQAAMKHGIEADLLARLGLGHADVPAIAATPHPVHDLDEDDRVVPGIIEQ